MLLCLLSQKELSFLYILGQSAITGNKDNANCLCQILEDLKKERGMGPGNQLVCTEIGDRELQESSDNSLAATVI